MPDSSAYKPSSAMLVIPGSYVFDFRVIFTSSNQCLFAKSAAYGICRNISREW